MSSSSIFKNFSVLIENKSLICITKDIKTGKYKDQVEQIRNLIANNQNEEAANLKKQLPAFTPSGTFENCRKAELLSVYSGYVLLDIDKLTPSELESAVEITSACEYTFAAFVSPSGNGLKVIVPVSTSKEYHLIAFKQVSEHYQQLLQLTVDPSGKDVSRLCFMSYDPNCYRNLSPTVFPVINTAPSTTQGALPIQGNPPQAPILITEELDEQQLLESINQCIQLTDKKYQYEQGNRNNYIFKLAHNFKWAKIPQNKAVEYILQNYDLPHQEVLTSIRSAYNYALSDFAINNDFATVAKSAILANSANSIENTLEVQLEDEQVNALPYFPDDIFQSLPEILKQSTTVFPNKRERDIALTCALAILSGCMHNVSGLYRSKVHYANIFTFIIAPAANGKGALEFAKELGTKYHYKFFDESILKQKQYKKDLQVYKRNLMDKNFDVSTAEEPEEPNFKTLFIAANNSSAGVIQNLKECGEVGIFCETEADSMGNAFKQDWGGYSDLIRRSFHHEPIQFYRKGNKERIEIKKPKFSIALSGTPGQVSNLIHSAEDGLFSRFLFYTFKSDIVWERANDTINGINLTEHFESLSYKVLNFVEYLNTTSEITFKLSPQQWDKLNDFGEKNLCLLVTFISEDLAGTVKRFGLILYRLAMILTALRYYDYSLANEEMFCSDIDFDIALSLINVYLEHSTYMFNTLPKSTPVIDKSLKSFYDALPINFTRKEAIFIAMDKTAIKVRTADSYLLKFTKLKLLDKSKAGTYLKIKV